MGPTRVALTSRLPTKNFQKIVDEGGACLGALFAFKSDPVYAGPMNKILVLFGLFLLWGQGAAMAQTITRVDALSFGSFALKNNNAAHQLTVSRVGGITKDAAYALITNPTPARYDLSGFPASTALSISIPDSTVESGIHVFTLNNFTPTPGLSTDGAGDATLRFGATLTTSGNTVMYADGAYSGLIDITVNY